MGNEIIDNIISQVTKEKNEFCSRLDHFFTQLVPYEEHESDSILKTPIAFKNDFVDGIYYYLEFLKWYNCFCHQIDETTFTILEKTDYSAFQKFVSKGTLTNYFNYKATVKEAYDYLSSVHSARCMMILSLLNNGRILYEYIQKQDYSEFLGTFSRTEKGINEFLETCGYFVCDQQVSLALTEFLSRNNHEISKISIFYEYFSSKDGPIRKIEQTLWGSVGTLINELDNIRELYAFDKFDKKIESLETEDEVYEFCNEYSKYNELIREKEKELIKALALVTKIMYSHHLDNFIEVHFKYYNNYINGIAIDIICNELWRDFTIPLFFEEVRNCGYSVRDKIINMNPPEHLIVTKAKEFLEIHGNDDVENTKGRKQSSWIKTMTNCPEEELGVIFKDEIWPDLYRRLKKFTYMDKNGIKLRGKELETAINALGACFIFYVVDSLGFADRKWSSYEKTTKLFLNVSRNTISSYIEIFDEYDRWLKNDRSNFDVFQRKNPKYYKILLNNFDLFTDTINYLTPKIKKLFEDNLTIKSND